MEVQYVHSLKQEGLVALKNYKKGELLYTLTGLITEKGICSASEEGLNKLFK